ncbi:MAG TPA: hypothetical protein VFB12_31050 [Ktedonobacteraceae bacterium]|nr:hypothetical protein [Ktedonobacteraceae bacterium]
MVEVNPFRENQFFQNLPEAGFEKIDFPGSPRRRRGFSIVEQMIEEFRKTQEQACNP